MSATVGPDGSPDSVYCIGVNIDENGGRNFRYGTQDAATYEDCRGGWPELEGSPLGSADPVGHRYEAKGSRV